MDRGERERERKIRGDVVARALLRPQLLFPTMLWCDPPDGWMEGWIFSPLFLAVASAHKFLFWVYCTVEYGYLHHFGPSKFDANIRLIQISVEH